MKAQGKGSTAKESAAQRAASHVRISDLHGASRLGLAALEQGIDIAQTLHGRLLGLAGWDSATGVSGSAWRRIRATTARAGLWIDARLDTPSPAPGPPSSAQRDAALAALNGVFGDALAAAGNPLAIPLQLRAHGHTLEMDAAALAAALPHATGKIVVLAHGLCCSDREWGRSHQHDHGKALGRDLGYTPIYLHYNSGLHISTNGREFAARLEQLVAAWPVEVEEIALIGHSMGGLVSRSACFYGKAAGHAWVGKLRHMVFLGTPHHGVPLERVANQVFAPLGKNVITAPLARVARLRSAGITDLRHGYLVDEDWQGRDRFAHAGEHRRKLALPRGVKCYAIAGSTGRRAGDLRERLLGDGLVPLDTALGRHHEAARSLRFAERRTWVACGVHHFGLLSRVEVYERIRDWLAQ